ncbi:Dyp-type peroxidase [Leucobacter sp. GX24907]
MTTPGTDHQISESATESHGYSRRALLAGGAAGALLGFAGGVSTAALRAREAVGSHVDEVIADPAAELSRGTGGTRPGFGGEALPCHGLHQAGVSTPTTAHVRYIAYRLRPETDRDALVRMFRILTGDVERLASGEGPLADPEPELAARPARLTVTVGVGPELVGRVDQSRCPPWLGPLPRFERDQLDDLYGDSDLLILLQADDPMPIAHAARMLERDLASFAERAWSQQGFRQARGAEADGTTMRNLMGQVDETVNPSAEDEDFSDIVWIGRSGRGTAGSGETSWLAGGTALVLRRIRMELDTWDRVDRPGREQTIGRRLSDGAPLTGGGEHTSADFEKVDALGLPVIPSYAHIRRARSENPAERIFRRSANYDTDGESGLLFACFQQDPLEQFVPIQKRLDELDLLNEWVTHIGSSVFAILPGFEPGEMLGEALLA